MRGFNLFALLFIGQVVCAQSLLMPWQSIDASGAQEITPFVIGGEHYLAVAQLANDIPHAPAYLGGGNADADVIIMKQDNQTFSPYQRIPSHGNKGAAYFTIDNDHFLAVASSRSGPKPPYNFNTYSKLYRWDGKRFYPVQQFFNLATSHWNHVQIDKRHFLVQANGINQDEFKSNLSTNSIIYEWDGQQFKSFQTLPTVSAVSSEFFDMNGDHYLVVADQVNRSILYKWNGLNFQVFQSFAGDGAQSFNYFTSGNKPFLAYANLTQDSVIYEWKENKWLPFQTLTGKGGRSFAKFSHNGETYLLRINFIHGTRLNPKTKLASPLYQWNGSQFEQVETITTFGGVQASLFDYDGMTMIAVANSLSETVRFKQPSMIYQVGESTKTQIANQDFPVR